jgi:hydrogenase maturation protein HypF
VSSAGGQHRARSIRLSGRVQGVGFRPFVYRLACRHNVVGWVQNQLGEVEIFAQGQEPDLDAFQADLISAAPPLSRPALASAREVPTGPLSDFRIVDSAAKHTARIHVPPDYFTCDDCVRELNDASDRRYRYPFINCTQCGPRYTLIRAMPYDRPNTSMAGFPLCAECRREYEDPADRRFHAEPVACPVCGPGLIFRDPEGRETRDNESALAKCLQALTGGAIVAVKGVGGYHLMCDAGNDDSIRRLRAAKPRPHKPLAVMVPVSGADGLTALRRETSPDAAEIERLLDPARPIVLLRRRADSHLSPLVAPGLNEIGVMLPYSPLHHLLLSSFGQPLIATSANISGEPVLTEAAEVEARLGHIVEACLHHDRPIVRPADDSVFRPMAFGLQPIRLGRGSTPLELSLPVPLERPTLAVGGHMKNTIALGWGDRLVVSPHIGDMGTVRSLSVFESVVEDLQTLFGVAAEQIVCDAHPQYATTRWARERGLPLTRIPHHHAHAAAAARDWSDDEPGIVFTWDGVGYGEDGSLWGGEMLIGNPGRWRRVASMRQFRLPGGERAGREPWRSAAGACWEAGLDCPVLPPDSELVAQAWRGGINAPYTSAVGRLFDAAAALTRLTITASFEGQGPMLLEAAADGCYDGMDLPLIRDDHGLWLTDWAPLLRMLMDDGQPLARRAAAFHDSLARAALAQALRVREDSSLQRVRLGGGVFQNRLLSEHLVSLLTGQGFEVMMDSTLPVNDGGLSAGQIFEFAARQRAADRTGSS